MRPDDVVYSAAKLFFAYGLGNALTFRCPSAPPRPVRRRRRPTPFSPSCGASSRPFSAAGDRLCGVLADSRCARAPARRGCASAFGRRSLAGAYRDAWKQRFGVDIVDGVGSTEMLHIFLSNTPDDIRYGTSGRAVPAMSCGCSTSRAGGRRRRDRQLFVSGPSAAEGYWNQRDKSRSTFGGAWTRTGRQVCPRADGATPTRPHDDMFKVSGLWVSPFEVESALLSIRRSWRPRSFPSADTDGLLKPEGYVVLKNRQRRRPISPPRCAST